MGHIGSTSVVCPISCVTSTHPALMLTATLAAPRGTWCARAFPLRRAPRILTAVRHCSHEETQPSGSLGWCQTQHIGKFSVQDLCSKSVPANPQEQEYNMYSMNFTQTHFKQFCNSQTAHGLAYQVDVMDMVRLAWRPLLNSRMKRQRLTCHLQGGRHGQNVPEMYLDRAGHGIKLVLVTPHIPMEVCPGQVQKQACTRRTLQIQNIP
eukprot:m.164517 g.164517  ORF g.164517 m.164517 type:complete len:208 (-) comp18112_c0_seq2:484-1107(-)